MVNYINNPKAYAISPNQILRMLLYLKIGQSWKYLMLKKISLEYTLILLVSLNITGPL